MLTSILMNRKVIIISQYISSTQSNEVKLEIEILKIIGR